jgi:hypothetical protein
MNSKLARALRSAIRDQRRPIPVSLMFVQRLSRSDGLTPEVVTWCKRHRLAVAQTGPDEFSFSAREVAQPRRGEFVGSLFADCP